MNKILIFVAACLLQFGLNAQTTTYLWSNGATTSTINVNPSVTTTYRVTITHGGVQYFDSLVVAVNENAKVLTFNTVFLSLFCNKPFDFLEFQII
jgi:hypothetical protein